MPLVLVTDHDSHHDSLLERLHHISINGLSLGFVKAPTNEGKRTTTTTLYQQQDYEPQKQDSKPEYRSISAYMGGHHAGKFDFDPRIYGVTALITKNR